MLEWRLNQKDLNDFDGLFSHVKILPKLPSVAAPGAAAERDDALDEDVIDAHGSKNTIKIFIKNDVMSLKSFFISLE